MPLPDQDGCGLLSSILCMIWAVSIEDDVWVGGCPQWLGVCVSLATSVLLAHLFRTVGGMAAMRGWSVAEIAGTSHGLSILSFVGFHGRGGSNLSEVVIAHWWLHPP